MNIDKKTYIKVPVALIRTCHTEEKLWQIKKLLATTFGQIVVNDEVKLS